MRRVRHSLRPLPPVLLVTFVLESSIELLNEMSDLTDGGKSASSRTAYRIFMLSCILSSRLSGFNIIFPSLCSIKLFLFVYQFLI